MVRLVPTTMVFTAFKRHEWRPLPVDYVGIPEHARMQYGYPREGVCTHYGWREDKEDTGLPDRFAVSLPDSVTIVPLICTQEEQQKIGPKEAENLLPLLVVAMDETMRTIQFASGDVLCDEDPRSCAQRILQDRFNMVARDIVPTLVYQPDKRVDSLSYTFLMFGVQPSSEIKKLEGKVGVVRVGQAFNGVASGLWRGEHEFFRRLILMHGYGNGPGLFEMNVRGSITAYSIESDNCCSGWVDHRGTPPPPPKTGKKKKK